MKNKMAQSQNSMGGVNNTLCNSELKSSKLESAGKMEEV